MSDSSPISIVFFKGNRQGMRFKWVFSYPDQGKLTNKLEQEIRLLFIHLPRYETTKAALAAIQAHLEASSNNLNKGNRKGMKVFSYPDEGQLLTKTNKVEREILLLFLLLPRYETSQALLAAIQAHLEANPSILSKGIPFPALQPVEVSKNYNVIFYVLSDFQLFGCFLCSTSAPNLAASMRLQTAADSAATTANLSSFVSKSHTSSPSWIPTESGLQTPCSTTTWAVTISRILCSPTGNTLPTAPFPPLPT